MKRLAIALAVLAASAGEGVAGAASDLVFTEGVFAEAETGTEIIYDHRLLGQETDRFKPFEDGEIRLAIEEAETGRALVVEFFSGDTRRGRNSFPDNIGNPLVMAFLETSLRSMANLTGGSPFYIRNRIKDDLRDGGVIRKVTVEVGGEAVAAREVRFTPFAEDANRARMGNFADLELVFVVSEAVPGFFVSMRANTPKHESGVDYFNEIITFSGSEVRE